MGLWSPSLKFAFMDEFSESDWRRASTPMVHLGARRYETAADRSRVISFCSSPPALTRVKPALAFIATTRVSSKKFFCAIADRYRVS